MLIGERIVRLTSVVLAVALTVRLLPVRRRARARREPSAALLLA